MIDQILSKESYESYRFLIDHTNFIPNSFGYGLTLDRQSNLDKASIASSGFMLTSLVIGVVQKWDSYEVNLKRAQATLKNFYENIPHFFGMFVHYVDFHTGKRYKKSEFSTIDTMLFINGMLVVDCFFDDAIIHEYSSKIFLRINWKKFIFKKNGRYLFRMAYNDLIKGDYLPDGQLGWIHQWDMMAEQLTMYVLASGSRTINEKLAKKLYLGFDRLVGGYDHYQFVYSPLGSLFVHQYSHAWFDFERNVDLKGFNWFINTQNVIKANYQYCQDQRINFKTFNEYSWGLSACDGPRGYEVYGAPPFDIDGFDKGSLDKRTDGTVAIYAMLASLPFCPDLVKNAIQKLVIAIPELIGPYGFYDSFNFENNKWIGKDYLSIDKGISLLMIDNYYHKTTWHYYMKHDFIQKGMKKLGFIDRKDKDGNN